MNFDSKAWKATTCNLKRVSVRVLHTIRDTPEAVYYHTFLRTYFSHPIIRVD